MCNKIIKFADEIETPNLINQQNRKSDSVQTNYHNQTNHNRDHPELLNKNKGPNSFDEEKRKTGTVPRNYESQKNYNRDHCEPITAEVIYKLYLFDIL